MYDPYGDEFPSVEVACHYHLEQVSVLREAGVDLVYAVTIPTFSEALGIAQAAERYDLDYTMGFILDENGSLRDGKTLAEAIRLIDEVVSKKPLGYLVTCTHASVVASLDGSRELLKRLIGVQANGSSLAKKTLASSTVAVSDDPEKFSNDMQELKEKFNLKVLGGCCGTSRMHLCQMAEKNTLPAKNSLANKF